MTGIFQNFMTGVDAGYRSADRERARLAQSEAADMLRRGDTTGAAQRLMTDGFFNEATTLTNVSMTNQRADARRKAGAAAGKGDWGGASQTLLGAGELDDGLAAETQGRNRAAGSLWQDDPKAAAALLASGGDMDGAGRLIDWSQRASEAERAEALCRSKVMAPILHNLQGVPYEQRRPLIQSQAAALGGAGFSPEQVAGFDPTDQNIRSLIDSTLGMEKLLGTFSQREVGDTLRTYRTTPHGVQEVRREDIPQTRAESLQRDRFEWEREREAERQKLINSAGDVLGPILQKHASGLPLSAGEQEILGRYMEGGNAGGGDVGALLAQLGGRAPPAAGDPNRPANGPARGGGGGTMQSPARPRSEADFNALPSGAWFINPADGRLLQKGQ